MQVLKSEKKLDVK